MDYSEVGLGLMTFLGGMASWFGISAKKGKSDMEHRVEKLEGGYRRLHDICLRLMESTKEDIEEIQSDLKNHTTSIDSKIDKMTDAVQRMQQSTAKIEGFYEAIFKAGAR